MEDIRLRASGVLAGLCVGMVFSAFCLSGCAESTTAVPAGGWAQSSSDSQFQTQGDRPATTKTLWAMADILASQGKDSECEYVLKRIIQNDSKFLPAYNSLAELQMRQGQTNAATSTLQDALRVGPEDPVLLNNLGMCWLVRRDYENALKAFDKAAGIAPENAKYRANMAVALGLMGREEESLELFRQILPEGQAARNMEVLRQARMDAERTAISPPL